MEIKKDFRTDQEKRQDAFNDLLKNGNIGQCAAINFCDDFFFVKLIKRREQDNMRLIKFKILGDRHGMDGPNLEFNLDSLDNTELIELL